MDPGGKKLERSLFTGHFGPMGVGAIFVSTLALHKLPSPKYPPETQQDYLALMLQPIVTFVVLGSIVIRASFPPLKSLSHRDRLDGLSIPFFTFGRSMTSSTSTFVSSLTRHGTPLSPPERITQITARWSPTIEVQVRAGNSTRT